MCHHGYTYNTLALSIRVSQLDGILINKFVLVLQYFCISYINMATCTLFVIYALPHNLRCLVILYAIKPVMYVANEHSQFHSKTADSERIY